MKSNYLFVLILLACGGKEIDLSKQTADQANQRCDEISTEFEQSILDLYPQTLTINGYHYKDDQLNDISEAIIQRLVNIGLRAERRLNTEVNRSLLNSDRIENEQRINTKIAYFNLLNQHWYQFYSTKPIDGVHLSVLNFLTKSHPLDSKKDVENFIQRVVDCKRKFRSALKRNQIQLENGFLAPRILVEKTISQMDSILTIDATTHEFYRRFKRETESLLSRDEKQKYLADLAYFAKNNLLERLRRWRDFLANDYLTKSFGSLSVLDLQDGKLLYNELIKFYGDSLDRQINSGSLQDFKPDQKIIDQILDTDPVDPSNYLLKLDDNRRTLLINAINSTNQTESYRQFFDLLRLIDQDIHQEGKSIAEIKSRLFENIQITEVDAGQIILIASEYPAYLRQFSLLLK
ncbi:MAG: DUF885 family protein [Calditrichaeota bacterium]|nr:DUF885 family protein [Calditrichota bacterium]